jgi:Protein of unknown function, DUF547
MKNFLFLVLCLSSLTLADNPENYTMLLQSYVNNEGLVNYEAWKANPDDLAKLQGYIDELASFDPSTLTGAEQIAFWINAYNTSALYEVLQRYPVDTIRPNTLGVIPERSFFTDAKHVIGGKNYSLDQIENDVLRTLGEPRIHFAINCASQSCPKLLNEAYDARKLNGQLDRQGQSFVNDPTRNQFDAATNTAKLSKIFDWFKGDFDSEGGVTAFLLTFAEGDAKTVLENPATKIEFLNYDWSLNKQ